MGGTDFSQVKGISGKFPKRQRFFFFWEYIYFIELVGKRVFFLFYLYLGKRLSIKLNFKKYWRPWINEHEEITCSSLKTKLVSCPFYRQRNRKGIDVMALDHRGSDRIKIISVPYFYFSAFSSNTTSGEWWLIPK